MLRGAALLGLDPEGPVLHLSWEGAWPGRRAGSGVRLRWHVTPCWVREAGQTQDPQALQNPHRAGEPDWVWLVGAQSIT